MPLIPLASHRRDVRHGLAACVLAWAALPGLAADFGPVEYARLSQARFATNGIAVPEAGIELRKDAATIRLESGRIFPMEPVNGAVTGFVFVGHGRFRLDVPDAFEVAQLRRFAQRQDLDSVDTPFTELVLRGVERLPDPMVFPLPDGVEYAPHVIAHDRQERWINDYRLDVDGRIVAGSRMPGDDYLLADVKSERFGWLLFQFEPWEQEEVTLRKLQAPGGIVETWVSLDRASERDANGRPTSEPPSIVDLTSVDIDADLANHRAELLVGNDEARPDPVRLRCRLEMIVHKDGVRALPFWLTERARVTSVRTSDGIELPFLRNAYGERSAGRDRDRFLGSLIVLVDRTLHEGQTFSLEVAYEIKTLNFLSGRDWYPEPPDSLNDRHTARLTVHGAKKIEVRAAGELESETVEGDVRTSVWVVRQPTKMLGFSFGRGFREESIRLDGAPEVVAFGASTGAVSGNMVRNVAVDVARSVKFFQDYFDVLLSVPRLRVTAISGYHGQAFDGFLHLAQSTFNEEHPGYSELFRAHEVAHQIWGHLVGWKSYRDQWLSEGFAEYSALLFVESVLPKDKYFDRMIQGMTSEQFGTLRMGGGTFAGRWEPTQAPVLQRELGPIAAGYRAGTSRLPNGYTIQSYDKGALVLNTLRTVLSSVSRDKDVFRLVMQDFVREFAGKAASTEDFQRLLERRVPGPWGPFFRAYVYGSAIPTYTWSWSAEWAEDNSGAFDLSISVDATDVPEGLVLPLPIAIELPHGNVKYSFVVMDAARRTFRIRVPSRPVRVALDPDGAVLARIVPRQ